MLFEKITEFLTMGGYGFYVWSAYGLTFILLVIPVVRVLCQFQKIGQKTKKNKHVTSSL